MKISIKNVIFALLYVFIILVVALVSFRSGKETGKLEQIIEVGQKLSTACFEELTNSKR